MAPIIAATETWETLECEWLARTLITGNTFLNVGANVDRSGTIIHLWRTTIPTEVVVYPMR